MLTMSACNSQCSRLQQAWCRQVMQEEPVLQGSFLLFWLVYLLTLSIGICCAYIVAILSPNMDVANAALPTYTVRIRLLLRCWTVSV